MLQKFTIEFTSHPRSTEPAGVYRTSDPVEAEDCLIKLLQAGSRILSIKHDGVAIPNAQSDKMIKVAGERLLSRLIEHSLDADAVEIRRRFGLAA